MQSLKDLTFTVSYKVCEKAHLMLLTLQARQTHYIYKLTQDVHASEIVSIDLNKLLVKQRSIQNCWIGGMQ